MCKSGYYGYRPIDFEGELFGGCTKCPTQGGADASSVLGNGWINGCYMPSNRTMTDDTGTYIFTQDWPYTQKKPGPERAPENDWNGFIAWCGQPDGQ